MCAYAAIASRLGYVSDPALPPLPRISDPMPLHYLLGEGLDFGSAHGIDAPVGLGGGAASASEPSRASTGKQRHGEGGSRRR